MSIKCLAIAALMACLGSIAGAATVQNGSFEDIGDQKLNRRGWNHFSNVPGWTGSPNIEIQSNRTLRSIDAQDGRRYAELDTNQDAGIYQDVVLNAGKYRLSFWYSPRVRATSTTTNDMTYDVTGNGKSLLSGMVRGAPNDDYPHGVWTLVKGSFVVEDTDTVRLFFAATGGSRYRGCGNCGALIDNVQLSSVPLPAGGMLLIGGIAAIGLMHRRRNRA